MQIYPEITVVYDDDYFVDALPQKRSDLSAAETSGYAWRWLITSGRVYLMRWDPATHQHLVLRERDGNIITLLRRHYIPHKSKKDNYSRHRLMIA